MTIDAKTVRLLIRGRVQGVGYRAFVAGEAGRRGLSGFVRNRRDGSVEAVLSGDAAKVDAVIAACRSGPRAAKVDAVEIQGRLEQSVGPFVVLPTA